MSKAIQVSCKSYSKICLLLLATTSLQFQ